MYSGVDLVAFWFSYAELRESFSIKNFFQSAQTAKFRMFAKRWKRGEREESGKERK